MHSKHSAFFWIFWIWLLLPQAALAHPMGNFSVNHYSRIDVQADHVQVQYVIDLAEIPAYQEIQAGNITATPGNPDVSRFVAGRGAELGHGLILTLGGRPLPLRLRSSNIIFPPGAGGLPTMKMGFMYEASFPASTDRAHAILHYTDTNYAGHSGWKEIVVVGQGSSLEKSSVPAKDRSAALNNYPTDLLNSPPQDLEASFEVTLLPVPVAAVVTPSQPSPEVQKRPSAIALLHAPLKHTGAVQLAPRIDAKPLSSVEHVPIAAPSIALKGNQQKTPRSRFTELITEQHLSAWFLFTAALIAMGLGALHALEPGHGKTIVAAYLVGSRGTARHAVLLGMIVTMSHTAGVFALGAITLYASRYIVPEQLYPWLGVLSGITIAGLGFYMLLRRLTGTATDHSHGPESTHGHWPFAAKTEVEAGQVKLQAAAAGRPVRLMQLFTLGVTGGIIPCPAALIVLLSAFALHRIALGFFLIVAFSLGLAAVLISFGIAMVYARRFMTHLQIDGPLTKRWLPIASATFITVLGLVIAFQALVATHLHLLALTRDKLGTVLFVSGLGLVLGMRHSTDADHVVAISTIVSNQRSIRNAAVIGSVWGLGHTITIFIVGSLIILFGVEIPPRVGLSMEFCVALMLILLGVLNLTGVMQKITARYTPAIMIPTGVSFDQDNGDSKVLRRGRFLKNTVTRLGFYQCLRPLAIGLVHGLAGSAAVALLVLTTIHNPVWATIYLLIFGGGTMVGMMCMTATIAIPLTYAGDRFTNLSRYFGVASGMVSLCFGCFLVYQLGFLGGLFTSHPQWTPR